MNAQEYGEAEVLQQAAGLIAMPPRLRPIRLTVARTVNSRMLLVSADGAAAAFAVFVAKLMMWTLVIRDGADFVVVAIVRMLRMIDALAHPVISRLAGLFRC